MIDFFLSRRVLTTLITFFIVVVGGWQALNVRRVAFPEVEFDMVTVTTAFPGASPEEVERLVTRRIEDQIRAVSGIDRVESTSIENRSMILIRLDEDLNARGVDRAVSDIEQAVGRAQDLPETADRPAVEELTSDRPLITLSVAGGAPGEEGDEARRDMAEQISDALEDIAGVSRVERQGYLKREIWIEADRRKLSDARLTLAEIAAAVEARNRDVSAGTVEIGPKELWVRVVGAVETAEDVGGIILRGTDDRTFLRVRDVARVSERFEEPRVLAKADGRPAVDLNVRKLKSGDTIELAEEVRKVREAFAPRARARDLDLILSDDVSFFIKRRLKVMTSNLAQGGLLILLALFIFLDWRLALVAAWGVPISLAAAFLVAVPMGFTINLMSLLAFIIVLGMLDDDSVVVAENIYRHLEMGKPPARAALEGAREVAVPVMASVAVSCCAFLPFALMSGIMGKFVQVIPLIVVMAFVASAFEAFFILPSHVLDLMPLGKPVGEKAGSRWYEAVVARYRRVIGWVLDHRGKFLLLVLAFLGATALVAKWRVKFILFPPGLIDQIFIKMDMPEGTGLTETERVFRRVEEAVLALPPEELESVRTSIGLKGFEQQVRMGTHYAQARVFFTPEEDRPRRTKAIVERLRAEVGLPEGAENIVFEELKPGPPVGSAVQVRVRGRDPETVGRIADKIKAELAAMAGARDIRDSREGGKSRLRLTLDPREAAYAGLSVAGVARNILLAVDGGEASEVRRPGEEEEIKIKVRLRPEQRAQPEELLALDVLNDRSQPVRLKEVASIQKTQGPPFLERYNFKPSVMVTADVDLAQITSREANLRIREKFAGISQEFPGYDLVFGGEEEETAKSLQSLYRAFLIAMFLNYVILAVVFRSYVQPAIMLLTIPIGLLGVVYALVLHGMPASFMALLGVVAMTGVILNNGIVLISFINDRRRAGASAREAAVEAGAVRLRPIWASSITTLLGLFPTAYGFGGHEPFVAPMALALAWGLAIAMPMTLFLIPLAYVLVDDVSTWFRTSAGRLMSGVLRRTR
ncbi:MAG: efflux RND transporter permease subunit [Elusimicrobiota bacterium]